jgi:hypothetical protein
MRFPQLGIPGPSGTVPLSVRPKSPWAPCFTLRDRQKPPAHFLTAITWRCSCCHDAVSIAPFCLPLAGSLCFCSEHYCTYQSSNNNVRLEIRGLVRTNFSIESQSVLDLPIIRVRVCNQIPRRRLIYQDPYSNPSSEKELAIRTAIGAGASANGLSGVGGSIHCGLGRRGSSSSVRVRMKKLQTTTMCLQSSRLGLLRTHFGLTNLAGSHVKKFVVNVCHHLLPVLVRATVSSPSSLWD